MKIAINGFGRIGRITLRALLNKAGIEVLAINDLSDTRTLAHLLKYDSVHGGFDGTVTTDVDHLIVNGHPIHVFAEKDPSLLPWQELGIDLVIESTGKFTSIQKASLHLQAGAKQVLISAPSPDKDVPTVVLGVNDDQVNLLSPILSNASCTTNNVAPMVKVLDDNWGIIDGYITTVHSTIFPHLDGKLGGAGIRVPVLNGSLTDFTCTLKTRPTKESINQAFKIASEGYLNGILEYTADPIVSVDVIDNPHSCVLDSELTSVVGELIKVVGWYDNESGYSNRIADLVVKISLLRKDAIT